MVLFFALRLSINFLKIILGQRFSYYLVFPVAALIGTVGYYAEKKLRSKPKPIPYLETSIIEVNYYILNNELPKAAL